MRNRIIIAAMYAEAYTRCAAHAAATTKDKVVEHRAELARLGVTAAVAGVTGRVVGFRAGYAYAQNN